MTARAVWVGVVVLATLAYYSWTAALAPGGWPRIHGEESDHFNLLSRGFQQGHLYLDHEVPRVLLEAKNPYDPALRQIVAVLHDASLYQGKYYIYFGPAPVVTLLLPFSLVTGRDLPLPYAVWFFSCGGYLALVGILCSLQRRYFPRASAATILAGLLAIGGASMVTAVLRRAHIWEISAASGFCFFSVSLLCLLRALPAARPGRWALAGGLALGLAVAARPTYILCSVLFALPWVFRRRHGDTPNRYDGRAVLAAAAGCAPIVLALLVYNFARFGNPFEFGQKYQLSAIVEGEARHFSLGYIAFNAKVYFLSRLPWLPHFPFVSGIEIPPLPPGYGGYEYVFGLFPNLPFSLLAFVALGVALRPAGRAAGPTAFWWSVAILAGGALINAGLLLCFFGSCIRYMLDFTPCVMLVAALGAFVAEDRLATRLQRGLLQAGAIALAMFSAFIAAAGVVHFYDPVPGEPPRAYRPVARALNAPVFWLQQQRWPDYGPREILVSFPAGRPARPEPLLAVKRANRITALVFVEYLDGGQVRLGYREPGSPRPPVFSPAVAIVPGRPYRLRLSIGGPYADFDGLRARLRAQLDDAAFWDVPAVSFGVYPGNLHVGADAAASGIGPQFSGEVHAVKPVVMPELARPALAGIRIRLSLKPSMVGHAYPLLTSGRTKAGDLFFIRVLAENKVSFGYDHWGEPLVTSPEIEVMPRPAHVVEFWAPALAPPGVTRTLVVKWDGTVVWQQPASAYAVTPETLFLGTNPIGGSTCEPTLENGVVEATQLPWLAP